MRKFTFLYSYFIICYSLLFIHYLDFFSWQLKIIFVKKCQGEISVIEFGRRIRNEKNRFSLTFSFKNRKIYCAKKSNSQTNREEFEMTTTFNRVLSKSLNFNFKRKGKETFENRNHFSLRDKEVEVKFKEILSKLISFEGQNFSLHIFRILNKCFSKTKEKRFKS